MKTKLLLLGFFEGIVSGVTLTLFLIGQKALANDSLPKHQKLINATVDWPDSLDAVTAAPANHKVVLRTIRSGYWR